VSVGGGPVTPSPLPPDSNCQFCKDTSREVERSAGSRVVSLSWPSWPGVVLPIVLIYVSGRPTIFFVTSKSTGCSTVTSTDSFVKPKKAILSTPVRPGVEPSVLSGLYV